MMTLTTYNFIKEPKGPVYAALLDWLVDHAATFSLVLRDSIPGTRESEEAMRALIARLQPIDQQAVSQWPGTEIFGHTALLYTFAYSPIHSALLRGVASGLFQWCQPRRPEDPCFYRANGECILATIAHERCAFLTLDEREHECLMRAVPGVVVTQSNGIGEQGYT